MTPHRREVMPM